MSRELKIGFVVTGAIILLVFGFQFLKGLNVLSPRNEFVSDFVDAKNIKKANPVVKNGVKVGQVTAVELHPNSPDSVRIRYTIDENIALYKGAVATIISSDILGSKALEIKVGTPNPESVLLPGTLVKGLIEQSLEESVAVELQPLKSKIVDLLGGLEEVSVTIQAALNEEVRNNLTASFKRIPRAIDNLTRTTESIDTLVTGQSRRLTSIFQDIESITSSLEKSNGDISATIENLSAVTDSLKNANLTQTINNAELVLTQTNLMLENLNNGQGTMGKMLSDSTLYYSLDHTAKSIDSLLVDIKTNPSKYLHVSLIDFK